MPLHGNQMEEALITLGVFRFLLRRQEAVKLHSDALRVDHLVFRGAGMDIQAPENCPGGSGIEVFVLNSPYRTAVHGVGIVRAKALYIKPVRSPADLLIGSKANLYGGMGSALGDQPLRGGEDLRDTGLVVRPQQGRAVCDNQVFAPVIVQGAVFRFPQPDILLFIQTNVPAGIRHNSGLDIRPGSVRRGVHMGDQADHRLLRISGNGSVNIAVFVHPGVLNAHVFHFCRQSRTK